MLKEAIKSLRADVVLLQEVAGVEASAEKSARSALVTPFQLEALADEIWPYSAYGRNSVFVGGFHGNAILSRFPITGFRNTDISVVKALVKRGILHATLDLGPQEFHAISTHLGLLEVERTQQVKRLFQYVKANVPAKGPLIIGGDFNDWRERVSIRVQKQLKMDEVFLKQEHKHARTFPALFPVLRLDRIYFRGVNLHKATRVRGRPWQLLSDHLPLIAEFDLT